MDSITTMQTDFKGLRAPPAESMKPAHTFMQSTDPLSTSSEFRDQFVAWPVHRPERREALKYKRPEGTIDLNSTQRTDFKLLNGRPALPIKPTVRLTKSHPFDGTTNYSNDFKRWPYQKLLVKPKEEWIPGEGKDNELVWWHFLSTSVLELQYFILGNLFTTWCLLLSNAQIKQWKQKMSNYKDLV